MLVIGKDNSGEGNSMTNEAEAENMEPVLGTES